MSRSPLRAALVGSALSLCFTAAYGSAFIPVAYAGAGDGALTVRVVYSVSGTGAYDPAVDTGIPDASVLVTDASGHAADGLTGPGGALRVDLGGLSGGRYRVQVTAPDGSGLLPAPAGRGLSSLTDFVNVSNGTNADPVMGLWDPDDYCQADPTLVSCNLQRGDQNTGLGLFSFEGVSGLSATEPGGPYDRLTAVGQQGAVFGIGTDRSGDVFAGTYVKRHTEYGPAGNMNAIYRYNAHDPGAGVSTFAVLPGTLTPHDASGSIPYIDDNAVYDKIGEEGLGGLAVTGDGSTLYAVDLNDKSLYSIPINGTGTTVTAGARSGVPIPTPQRDCVGGWHPFGLGVHDSTVYVGGVCGAESTVTRATPWGDPSRERAFVYRYSNGTFTQILDFALGYPRGCAYYYKPGGAGQCEPRVGGVLSGYWEAWNERTPTPGRFGFSSSPQPMLTSIDVTGKGDLVLAFRDRYPDMEGTGLHIHDGAATVTAIGAGDLLKACVSGGTYTLENDGKCGGVSGAAVGNGHGPGGGEFFDNVWQDSDARQDHTATGGSTYLPGYNDEWGTRVDPFDDNPWHKGVSLYSRTGAPTSGIEIGGSDQGSDVHFGKGNALADLEKLCDEAPVQIGDRVWYDANRNGIQDPAEPGVAGVAVTLRTTGGAIVATTTTDADGDYYFGTHDGLRPSTVYTVSLDASGATGLPSGITPAQLSWSPQNAGPQRCLDSDVNAAGVAIVAVGAAGDVNECVDAGLMPPSDSIGDRVWYDANRDGIQDPGEPGIGGVTVNLQNPGGTVIDTTVTDSQGTYLFPDLSDGNYRVCFAKDSLPATYSDGAFTTLNAAGGNGTDSQADPTTGCTGYVALGPDLRQDLNLDAGIVTPPNTVGDRVWFDANRNGIQDPGEPGVGGVTETLVDATGNPVGIMTTNAQGMYLFTNMPNGTYHVCFNLATFPAGDKLTTAYAHGGNGTDSAADQRTGCTDPVTLGPAHRVNLALDAGLVKPLVARVAPSGPTSGFLARTGLDLPLSGLLALGIAASAAGIYLFAWRRRQTA
jgi:SdrD B-like domain